MSPLTARCRTAVTGLATLAAAGALAAPAAAATTPVAAGCPAKPMVQPFLSWGDVDNYVLAPGGNVEEPRSTWTLRGGAVAVEGNEPWYVGAKTDHRSLSLPVGSSATTVPMCIGVEHRTMRFFAKSRQAGSVAVEVLYADAAGKASSVRIGTVKTLASWAPTAVLPMVVNELAAARGNAMMVSLRFTAATAATIDDVYVDPFRTN